MAKLRQVLLVYQDCALCGADSNKILRAAAQGKIMLVKLPFFAKGAKELILEAKNRGVSVPFFTDGEVFSKKLSDFTKKGKKNVAKK